MAKKSEQKHIQARKLKASGLTYEEVGNKMGISRQGAYSLIAPSPSKRKAIIQSRNHLCDRCHLHRTKLYLHFISYDSNENIEVLCSHCHRIADQENGTMPIRIRQPKKYKVLPIHNTSGYRGIVLHKPSGLWQACISMHGKIHSLGYFKDKISAAKAYDKASIKYHGDHSRTNFG